VVVQVACQIFQNALRLFWAKPPGAWPPIVQLLVILTLRPLSPLFLCRDFGLSRMLGIGDTHVETEVRLMLTVLASTTRHLLASDALMVDDRPLPQINCACPAHPNRSRTLARLPMLPPSC